MNKDILKNGMIAETVSGLRYLRVDNLLIGTHEHTMLDCYNEQLIHKKREELTIKKIYKTTELYGLHLILDDCHLELEQERAKEINWNKVPKGTIILAKNGKYCDWSSHTLLTYLGDELDEELSHRFIVYDDYKQEDWKSFKYATIYNPKEEWLI